MLGTLPDVTWDALTFERTAEGAQRGQQLVLDDGEARLVLVSVAAGVRQGSHVHVLHDPLHRRHEPHARRVQDAAETVDVS